MRYVYIYKRHTLHNIQYNTIIVIIRHIIDSTNADPSRDVMISAIKVTTVVYIYIVQEKNIKPKTSYNY